MTRFALRRVVRGLVALIQFQTLFFALLHALPHDFSSQSSAGPQHRQFIQHLYGLDLPRWEQYGRWWGCAAAY